jgi:hypothetical protein
MTLKNTRRLLKIKLVSLSIGRTLLLVPGELHLRSVYTFWRSVNATNSRYNGRDQRHLRPGGICGSIFRTGSNVRCIQKLYLQPTKLVARRQSRLSKDASFSRTGFAKWQDHALRQTPPRQQSRSFELCNRLSTGIAVPPRDV